MTESHRPADDLDDPELAAMADAILGDGEAPGATESPGRPSPLAEPLHVLAKIAALHRSLGLSDTSLPTTVESPERLHTWGHLRIIGKIGQGAFGTVFRAWDPHLNRAVALKLLEHADRDKNGAWVLEEARHLAAIRHPNVITVYGADRVDGDVGFWTELIEGQTLAELVSARGPLGEAEAIEIGLDVCHAVSAVHDAGLLHRDIKANNVMREKTGRIVLLDFGATMNALLDTAPSARIGDPNGPTGTPLYAAPELWQQQPASARSDVYSIGVLLYFLLTGAYPVEGETVADVSAAHRRGARVTLKERRPDLGYAADVVERALAREPSRRFATAQGLAAALHGAHPTARDSTNWRRFSFPALTLVLALAAAVGVAIVLSNTTAPPPAVLDFKALDSVLIAPFDNRTGDPQLDGAVEASLQHELANSQFVTVVGRQRVIDALALMQKGPETALTLDVAREVCVRDGLIRALVVGRVQRIANTYTVTAQVMEPREGTVLSSDAEVVDREERLSSAIRDLALKVRRKLGEAVDTVQKSEEQLERVTSPSLKAVQLYAQAYNAGAVGVDWQVSAQRAREAIALDPTFASAHAWLGWSLLSTGGTAFQEALLEFEQAVRLSKGATERERLFIRASHSAALKQNDKAIGEFESLLRMFPEDRWAAFILNSLYPAPRQRADKFWRDLARAWPTSPQANFFVAQLAIALNTDAGRAEEAFQRATKLAPANSSEKAWLDLAPAALAWLNGDASRVAEELQRARAAWAPFGNAAQRFIERAAQIELALGRAREAEALFRTLSTPWIRESYLALASLSREDYVSTVRHLEGKSPPDGSFGFVTWMLGRAGRPDLAADVLTRHLARAGASPFTVSAQLYAARLSIDLANGRASSAASVAREAQNAGLGLSGFGAIGLRLVENMAEALFRGGDGTGAVRLLEVVRERKSEALGGQIMSGYYWIRTQLLLTRVYRHLGRRADAEALEKELLKMLQHADADFPIVHALRTAK